MKKWILLAALFGLSFSIFVDLAFAQTNNVIYERIRFSKQLLSGTLLVNYFETRHSSTYIEIDLCSSGYFRKSVDGNFSTGRYQSGNPYASGASSGNYSGTWKVISDQGLIYLVLTDQDGPAYYEIGWNDQYRKLYLNGINWAYQQGGSRCR